MEISNIGINEKQLLEDAGKLMEMAETRGWKEVIVPYLEARSTHAWEDPQNVENTDKFFYRYVVQWAKAEAANQLLKMVSETVDHAKQVREKNSKGGEE